MLNNIVDNNEQCGQQNIVQCCSTLSIFISQSDVYDLAVQLKNSLKDKHLVPSLLLGDECFNVV